MYEIKLVEWGTANKYPDEKVIEFHKDLMDYPELLEPLIAHEFSHTDKGFSLTDLAHDIKPIKIPRWKMMKFMFSRPKTWIQWSPIIIRNGQLVFDINHLVIYLLIVVTWASIFLIIL